MRTAALFLTAVMAACSTKTPQPALAPPKRAFYYWRTTLKLSPPEQAVLSAAHVGRLYLRLFDVEKGSDGVAKPVGLTTFLEPLPTGVEVVPVVFLRNDVFVGVAVHDSEGLAERVLALVRSRSVEGHFSVGELQVDCDWTESTREAYFAFVKHLGVLLAGDGTSLSATIRLHQVKYSRRTGVPPVARGMLMFYNMGSLSADARRSSIFNEEDAKAYTASLDSYPLPLDVALPVFSWAVQSRDGRVVGLWSKPDVAALAAEPALRVDGDHLVAQQAMALAGEYLREGDTLRLEQTTPRTTKAAAALLAQHFHPRQPFTVALFDLDESNVKAWSAEELQALWSTVR